MNKHERKSELISYPYAISTIISWTGQNDNPSVKNLLPVHSDCFEKYSEYFFMFVAILKATNNYFQKGILFA